MTQEKVALVVDDSLTIRRLVGQVLSRSGFRVIEGADGQQGLDQLAAHRVDLVFTDINMPVMDGIRFIRAMREREECRFTPVVVLTTEIEETKKRDARAAGATGWILKPFHPEKILTVIHRVFG